MLPNTLSFVTLAVKDLDKMSRFYQEQFGWKPMKEVDGIAFFLLNGTVLGLYPELAADIGVEAISSGFRRFSLAINFSSEQEVDAAFAELKEKGVRIAKPAEKVFWGGYSGYIADPEDNYWELAFNPFVELDEKGSVIRHL